MDSSSLFILRYSVFGIHNSSHPDGKGGLALGQVGAVVDLGDPALPPALPQVDPGGGGVRQNVASDRLLRVRLQAAGKGKKQLTI